MALITEVIYQQEISAFHAKSYVVHFFRKIHAKLL